MHGDKVLPHGLPCHEAIAGGRTMKKSDLNVLAIEDNIDDAHLVKIMLSR
jgi:hypothetical protein